MNFYMQDELSDLSRKIIKKIKIHQDGEVSSKMKRNGIVYKINYGVSIIYLRKIAQQYANNTKLALRLWSSDIREAKIIAILIANPVDKEITDNLHRMVNEIEHFEIAELFGNKIISNLPNCISWCLKSIESENLFVNCAAWVALATYVQDKKEITKQDWNLFSKYISSGNNNIFIVKSKARFLRMLSRLSKDYLTCIDLFINQNKENIDIRIFEEVKTEIDFLKS